MELPQKRNLSEVGGLREGETVLKVVRPVSWLYPWREFLSLLLAGFLIVGGVRVLLDDRPDEPAEAAAMVVLALLFMGFGGLLVARILMLMRRAQTTVYVLTNQRFIEFFRWFGQRSARSVDWGGIMAHRRIPLLGRTGDVALQIGGNPGWAGWIGWRARGLLAVRDCPQLADIVAEQIEAARQARR